tara:strand:- start:361 stop:1749 length:1389 start_codon:yes stop_codon:yes gene_type:complete
MSISIEFLSKFKQNLSVKKENKNVYGEVFTNFTLIDKMLDMLPQELFQNPNLKWLDPCAGTGYFMMKVYQRLMTGLSTQKKALKKRHHHIITKQLYMIEINKEHLDGLFQVFGENANIIMGNYLNFNNLQFDVIVGNPPFNINGAIKVPTNKGVVKKKDGKAIWGEFVMHSFNNLTKEGYLCFITPSIWLKRDHKMHEAILRKSDKLKIVCLTNTETNKVFNGEAQTPTCYFTLKKSDKVTINKNIAIYNQKSSKFVLLKKTFNNSIPLCYPSIIEKLLTWVTKVGCIDVIKTSMRPGYKGLKTGIHMTKKTPYINIKTCTLNFLNYTQPQLVTNYSNIQCSYYGVPKLVLAHKMYGFPYYDKNGIFGISNRDNYVIINKTENAFLKIKTFLSLKLAFLVYETTRYRMKYLERYAFEFMPDITKIPDFPDDINDKTVADFFNFNEMERLWIKKITKKNYSTF